MERIELEIAKTNPDVPFRAVRAHTHHTWARTFQSRPELYIQPESVEEVQKIVTLARRCRRRIVVVGSGHSPSDLTCTSSWMVNLDNLGRLLKVDQSKKTLLVEGGIRLRRLNQEANQHGLTMPNLGSIDEQSIVGAISTATHGSSLWHGLLSESIRSLRVVLSNGQAVRCSSGHNEELFRAALVSLGALGIIVEVEFEMIDACNIEWEQTMLPLSNILERWDSTLWTQKEYTRVWWMPYMKRAIVWSAEKTDKPLRSPTESWYGGSVGFHTYHNLLWLSNYVPAILPWVEWFVFGMQYGFSTHQTTSAVEPLQTGLLMNCLYSQTVNEWALPLTRGPEALTRLSAWINREPGNGGIPFSSAGLYVHCPIEVRVSDTTKHSPPSPSLPTLPASSSPPPSLRPYLDPTSASGPTLYLNATLYRPYHNEPPCRDRYYQAFEWLMRELGGRPHFAKNFSDTSAEYIRSSFGENFTRWQEVRDRVDPEGMFLGEWHRRALGLGAEQREAEGEKGAFVLQEREVRRTPATDGGMVWVGEVRGDDGGEDGGVVGTGAAAFRASPLQLTAAPSGEREQKLESPGASSSASSFDFMHSAEAEKSTLFFTGSEYVEAEEEDEGEATDRDSRFHGHPKQKWTGTAMFDKM